MKSHIQRDDISYKYDIIEMKDIACEALLYHDNPSAVALSILCDFEGRDKQMVVNTILKRIKELTKGDERAYRDYLKKVNVLSTNRDLEKEVEKGAKMLSVDIKKTLFYKMGIQDGLERGMEKGMERGMKKGVEKGIEKVAIAMIKENIGIEIIQTTTGLSLAQIEALRGE